MGGLRSPHLQYSLIHSVVISRGSSQISDLHLQSPISNVVILGRIRSPISISNLQSPISIRGPGGGGGLKPSRRCNLDSFTLTISHLQSPIFYLATVAAGSNLRPPFSIFDLTSGADGWALGSTICILHLLSPHFGPVGSLLLLRAICNPQSQSSIFSLEWGTGQDGSTGETWACPCERSARISSLNLLSLPQRSTGLAQRFPLLKSLGRCGSARRKDLFALLYHPWVVI